ncbi:MAG: carboxypeptidase regulatory-like domain-containing protein [Planctomycetes bacterium]|nr:carboxypeptidase regulatory-like domain-containing protein [Planctomycetota bacterium]
MARRNNFLVLTLLVMVGVLIVAILTSGPADRPGPAGGEPGASTAGGANAGDARSAVAGQDETVAARREAVAPGGADTAGGPTGTAGPATLCGRLVDVGGGPRAGVELTFGPRRDDAIGPLSLAERDGAGELRATTAADGRFRFAIDAASPGQLELVRAANLLFTSSESRRLQVSRLRGDVDLGDLTVAAAAAIAGRVVDERGAPVTAAGVRVNPAIGGSWRPGTELAVDADGRFELLGLQPGTQRVAAACPGYVPATVAVELAAGERRDDVVVTLARGASVAGTIVDDLGRPLEGARVAAYRARRLSADVSAENLDPSEAVTTDGNGYFVLSGLEGETVTLRAWADGHVGATRAEVAVGTADVRLELERYGLVTGVLVDTALNPLAGSEVTAAVTTAPQPDAGRFADLDRLRRVSATTAADGTFRLDGVPPGAVALAARGAGHLPVEGRTVQLVAGQVVSNVRLVAETGAGLAVQVLAPDGTPVSGATVEVFARRDERPAPGDGPIRVATRSVRSAPGGGFVLDDGRGERLGSGRTDAEGRVRIGGLPAGTAIVRASHAELAPPRPQQVQLPRTGVAEAVLTLRAAGFLDVRAFDADGEPLAAARFAVRPAPALQSEPTTARTDDVGVARVGPLLVGAYEVQLLLPEQPLSLGDGMSFAVAGGLGDAQPIGAVVAVDVRAGETARVVLKRPVLTTLHGVVRDALGPAAGIDVKLRPADAMPFASAGAAKSDATGAYRIEELPPGVYELSYSRPDDLVPHRTTLEIAAGTPELLHDLLLGGGVVTLRVVDAASGQPVPRARVSLRTAEPGGGQAMRTSVVMIGVAAGAGDAGAGFSSLTMGDGRREVETDADGAVRIEGVPAGQYALHVESDDHAPLSRPGVRVVDQQVTELGNVTMSTAGAVAGALTGFTADDPVQAAEIEVRVPGEPEPARREIAHGGSFRIDGLEPGTYELRARPLGVQQAPAGPAATVVVVAGETAPVDLAVR